MPKYVRVNTNKISVDDALRHFRKLGFQVRGSESEGLHQSWQHEAKWVKLDDTVPNLIALGPPSSIQFHSDPLFRDSSIIVQDKSSCLPVYALQCALQSLQMDTRSNKFEFVDACAAPGNKTTYLASLYPDCKVIAFDKDKKRAHALRKRTKAAGCANVDVHWEDFLKTDPSSFKHVRALIVDPSCSGSGLIVREVNRLDVANTSGSRPSVKEMKRIEKLAEFQERVVEHALRCKCITTTLHSWNALTVEYSTFSPKRTSGHIFDMFNALRRE